ncbi:MAG: penicillin-binding protein activator LpoB [Proteobacteria bacterium]|nr:penicillin-binding protein activator LpoB [Pseudomonadota bacterium]
MRSPPKATLWTVLILGAALSGCATVQMNAAPTPHPDSQAVWCVVAPMNNTSTPYAGGRVQQQLAALLGARGLPHVLVAPSRDGSGPLPIGDDAKSQSNALDWAHRHDARYALLGSVDEWHYKIGLDGQPAVGFTLRLIDLHSGKTLWSGAASASGGSREGLAVLSERTLARLVGHLLP